MANCPVCNSELHDYLNYCPVCNYVKSGDSSNAASESRQTVKLKAFRKENKDYYDTHDQPPRPSRANGLIGHGMKDEIRAWKRYSKQQKQYQKAKEYPIYKATAYNATAPKNNGKNSRVSIVFGVISAVCFLLIVIGFFTPVIKASAMGQSDTMWLFSEDWANLKEVISPVFIRISFILCIIGAIAAAAELYAYFYLHKDISIFKAGVAITTFIGGILLTISASLLVKDMTEINPMAEMSMGCGAILGIIGTYLIAVICAVRCLPVNKIKLKLLNKLKQEMDEID